MTHPKDEVVYNVDLVDESTAGQLTALSEVRRRLAAAADPVAADWALKVVDRYAQEIQLANIDEDDDGPAVNLPKFPSEG